MKKFEKWCDKRKISVDIKTVSPTDLTEILRKFFAEVKTEKGQAVYERKECKTKTQIIYSVRRHAEIESILHGRAEQGQRLERCGEVS